MQKSSALCGSAAAYVAFQATGPPVGVAKAERSVAIKNMRPSRGRRSEHL